MIWPFKRKPKPGARRFIPPVDTWAAGDIAECVDVLHPSSSNIAPPPAIGAQGMVLSIIRGDIAGTNLEGVGLRIIGYPDHWQANCFRKIILTESAADRKVSDKRPVGEPA